MAEWLRRSPTWTWLFLGLAALSLLWPAFLNGEPLLFTDTSAYVRAVDAGVVKATGYRTDWTREGEIERLSSLKQRSIATSRASPPTTLEANRVPLLGRSVYYGVVVYTSSLLGSFWLLALLQAAVFSFAVLLVDRRFSGSGQQLRPLRSAILLLIISATSTAPFFCSFAMPDLFAGLAVLAAAMLLTDRAEERRWERYAWLMIAGAAALFHASHVLILLGMAAIAILLSRIRWLEFRRSGLALALLAAVLGLAGEWLFSSGVEYVTGRAPIRPPFIMARLIDDGPGYRFLRKRCPQSDFYVCRFPNRLPLPSDGFLWDTDPRVGVFNTLDPAGKQKLADEQMRFVTSVVMDRPLEVVGSTLTSTGHQLALMGVPEFNYPGFFDPSGLPAVERAEAQHSRAARGEMPTRLVSAISFLASVLSLVILAYLAWLRKVDQQLLILVISGILLNALVCGGLSTPHDRYQARVIWLLPLFAAAALISPRSSLRASPSCQRRP